MIFIVNNVPFKFSKDGAYVNWHSWMFSIKGLWLQVTFGIGSVADAYIKVLNGGLSNRENVAKAIENIYLNVKR